MSKRGATHKGPYGKHHKRMGKWPAGQRNRKRDRDDGKLADVPLWLVQKMARTCRSKVAHATYGAAYAAKRASEKEFGKEFSIYECPICGKYHLTTNPRKNSLD